MTKLRNRCHVNILFATVKPFWKSKQLLTSNQTFHWRFVPLNSRPCLMMWILHIELYDSVSSSLYPQGKGLTMHSSNANLHEACKSGNLIQIICKIQFSSTRTLNKDPKLIVLHPTVKLLSVTASFRWKENVERYCKSSKGNTCIVRHVSLFNK